MISLHYQWGITVPHWNSSFSLLQEDEKGVFRHQTLVNKKTKSHLSNPFVWFRKFSRLKEIWNFVKFCAEWPVETICHENCIMTVFRWIILNILVCFIFIFTIHDLQRHFIQMVTKSQTYVLDETEEVTWANNVMFQWKLHQQHLIVPLILSTKVTKSDCQTKIIKEFFCRWRYFCCFSFLLMTICTAWDHTTDCTEGCEFTTKFSED